MPVQIGNLVGLPGRSVNGEWEIVPGDDGFSMPVSIATGHKGDLRILVATGPEHSSHIAQKALWEIRNLIDPELMHGTLITIDSFASKWETLPNANKPAFPGWLKGDLTEQVAHLILTDLLKHVDYALFLEGPKSGMRQIPHAALYTSDDPPMTCCHPEILKMMGHDLIVQKTGGRGTLIIEAQRALALPILVAQLDNTEESESTIKWIQEKVLNFLAYTELLDIKPMIPDRTYVATREYEIRANRDGEIQFDLTLGDFVSSDEKIAIIQGVSERDCCEIISDHNGYLVSHRDPGPVIIDDLLCSFLGVKFIKDRPGKIFCDTAIDNSNMDVNLSPNLLFKGLVDE